MLKTITATMNRHEDALDSIDARLTAMDARLKAIDELLEQSNTRMKNAGFGA